MASHLVVTLVGSVVAAAAGGFAVGVGAAASTGDGSLLIEMVWALLVFVPAVGVLAGAAFALWAWWPRLGMLAWVGLVWAALAGLLAEVLDLPAWALDLSPLQHVPALPAARFEALPLVVMGAVTGVLVLLGVVGFRRRDLSTT